MNNSIFSKLVPKETKFFAMFLEQANILSEAAEHLSVCLKDYSREKAIEGFKKVKGCERRGDDVTNAIFDSLNTTFITPFDREDIHDLANEIDDITDAINKCAKRIAIYNPIKIPPVAVDLCEILKKSVALIIKVIGGLGHLKKSEEIIVLCEEIHKLENQADDVYEKFIIHLFKNETNAVEIIKLKEIMHELEQAIDATEDVGKIVKTIIVKYA